MVYDNVGNLQTVTYPNGVAHGYTYDTRNRLTNLGVNKSATAIASYAYTLDAAGHRTQVTELSGRTVNYGCDSIYRLTNETIVGDPSNVNGAASYVYDAVGNRTQKTSTIPGFPGGLTNYNANDQLSTDTYDNDGNTTASNGLGYVYDFESHVIQAGSGITMVYDGDGNRVQKTVAGVTTKYLVDTQSPTGYAQVVYETFNGSTSASREISRIFVYGLERISQFRSYVLNSASHTQTSYYVYDGHGSTRALTDPIGAVTDTYDYDAFGNLIHSSFSGIPPGGTAPAPTPNEFLFAGEQFDSDLNLYYNRARYLNVSTGRFWTMDAFEGDPESPASLHKYLYVSADPANDLDRSGHEIDLVSVAVTGALIGALAGATIGALEGGVKGAFVGALVGAVSGAGLPIAVIYATPVVAAVTGLTTTAAFFGLNTAILELSLFFEFQHYASARTKRQKAAAVASMVFSFAMFGLSIAGAAASLSAAPSDDVVISIARSDMPPELVEPNGAKLAQMIARAGVRGQNARGQYMELARSIRAQALQDGTYANGDYFTNVNNPGATIYRVGNTYMAVAQDGTILSYVQGADPTWGIALKYQSLGGK
jgi:RHS repeat-associated protein